MNTATPGQLKFLGSLTAERRWEDVPALETIVTDARSAYSNGQLTKLRASQVIDHLMYAPKRLDTVAKTQEPAENIEGMHRLDSVIYKVQEAKNGSGRLYAKKLTQDGEGWAFEYAPGAVRKLSASTKMSLEEAKEFGALYGTCCVCGRALTDENSIAAGIGPVCAGKF